MWRSEWKVGLVASLLIGSSYVFLSGSNQAKPQAPQAPAPQQGGGALQGREPGQNAAVADPANGQNPMPVASPVVQDPAAEATMAKKVAVQRPEQKVNSHDLADDFKPGKAPLSSQALASQPGKGRITGFEFSRDPLNADRPNAQFAEVMKRESEGKAGVMTAQRKWLEDHYNLTPAAVKGVTMTRGKPVLAGPTAKLAQGHSFDQLAQMTPEDIKTKALFPYPPLPHPLHANGGQVFPKFQIDMFPRLQRFDVDFDLPDAFLPEFPPAIFLQNRPELGDVSRGQVVHLGNFRELFKEIMTPVQLEGMRMLLTPLPQEEFNLTDDRKSPSPQMGVACFDCHVNGHTTGQFHLSPDIRPQERRFRLDTTSLRGLFNQQIHGSKRSLRSVEDFTEFEQRTAYFNGDSIRAMKKGFQEIPRSLVPHMAQAQNMFDFPPAPKLTVLGKLDTKKATDQEKRGEVLFMGKGQCSVCHPAPFFTDHQMHDLRLERFLLEPGDGPIKSFTLRGIKESPPYLHDGRCLTLEDTVEFFNLVLELHLTAEEKADLAAYLRCL